MWLRRCKRLDGAVMWADGYEAGEEAGREAAYRDVYLPVVDGLRARYKALAERHETVVSRLHRELDTMENRYWDECNLTRELTERLESERPDEYLVQQIKRLARTARTYLIKGNDKDRLALEDSLLRFREWAKNNRIMAGE